MTKQELNCVFTIIDLCEAYSKEYYKENGVENVVHTDALKHHLLNAFDTEVTVCTPITTELDSE